MPSTPLPPEARATQLRWLTHGVELALDKLGPRAACRDAIWFLIEESLKTFEKVPDREQMWLNPPSLSAGAGQVQMTLTEALEVERLRIMSGLLPFDGYTRTTLDRDAVNRAYDVLVWLRWCNRGEDLKLSKAAVLLARDKPTAAARTFRPGRLDRQTTKTCSEIKAQTIGRILRGLREEHGIVPSPDGVRFQEFRR